MIKAIRRKGKIVGYGVYHAHPKRKGNKTDKPKGTLIKAFHTKKEALAMHRAIMISKKKR